MCEFPANPPAIGLDLMMEVGTRKQQVIIQKSQNALNAFTQNVL